MISRMSNPLSARSVLAIMLGQPIRVIACSPHSPSLSNSVISFSLFLRDCLCLFHGGEEEM